jgi:hypothetical protein
MHEFRETHIFKGKTKWHNLQELMVILSQLHG